MATGTAERKQATRANQVGAPPPEPEHLPCPRCSSTNTKFCYYNNYSLTQPRHFCKTCRRYWTKGGALRNVPIGGGCRKNKKTKSPSGDSKASAASSDVGGFKFFQGLSPPVDFQPQIHSSNTNFLFTQFPSFGGLSNASAAISHATSCFNLDPSLMAFGLPLSSSSLKQGQEMGSASVHANLASSIQSLSSINQDLHWKLQQQRLATLFVEDGRKETSGNIEKPQPIQFHNLEKPMADSYPIKDNNFSSAEWGFSNSYAPLAPIPATSSSNHLNGNSANWGTGIQAWSEMNQYNSLA